MSSAVILCAARGQNLVEKLFVCQSYFDKGLVGVRFFKEGKWMDVAIDTCIPCNGGKGGSSPKGAPFSARNKDPSEFWMVFLEKAYAKLHGSYECLDAGNMNEALADLTGAAPGSVSVLDLFSACLHNGKCDKAKALHLLQSRAHGLLLQGAGASGGNEEPLGGGLVSGHAYAINKTVSLQGGHTLVQLRNPWGGHEWTGAWCDKDPRWTPALKQEAGQADKEDGMFWMSVEDFAVRSRVKFSMKKRENGY